jgi:hypothetical protein
MSSWRVKLRRVVIETYEVEAESTEEAKKEALKDDWIGYLKDTGIEIDQEDYCEFLEVLSVNAVEK